MGHCTECVKPGIPVLSLLMLESSDTLVLVNEDLMLSQHNMLADGKFQQTREVGYFVFEEAEFSSSN
jgi:hypothetical protein